MTQPEPTNLNSPREVIVRAFRIMFDRFTIIGTFSGRGLCCFVLPVGPGHVVADLRAKSGCNKAHSFVNGARFVAIPLSSLVFITAALHYLNPIGSSEVIVKLAASAQPTVSLSQNSVYVTRRLWKIGMLLDIRWRVRSLEEPTPLHEQLTRLPRVFAIPKPCTCYRRIIGSVRECTRQSNCAQTTVWSDADASVRGSHRTRGKYLRVSPALPGSARKL